MLQTVSACIYSLGRLQWQHCCFKKQAGWQNGHPIIFYKLWDQVDLSGREWLLLPISTAKQAKLKVHIPFVPLDRQSMPRNGLFSFTWRDLTSASVWIGDKPLFSARASGMLSRASANERTAYCSSVEICLNNTVINYNCWVKSDLSSLYFKLHSLLTHTSHNSCPDYTPP